MSIKDRRTKILLGYFLISDVSFSGHVFDEKIIKTFDLSLNQKTKATISRLVKEELLEKLPEDNSLTSVEVSAIALKNQISSQSMYRLTEKGFYELCLQFPFFRFLRDRWDGKWRILSYEIPEKKRELRDKLRREVAGWGLGPWHRSFWVTPHPMIQNLRQLISQKEEERYVQAFESEHVFGDKEIFIEKVWGVSVLDKKYRELFKKWHEIISSQGDKIYKFRQIVSFYVEILKQDSGLPKELVGEKWIGFEAFNIFKEIRSILLS